MTTNNATLLVVDDDPGLLKALRRALTLHGFAVDTSTTGQGTLSYLSMGSPDAIILDVSIPDPDGLEICRRLRLAGDTTPVLMLTARDAVSDRVEGLDAGADDYLVKPFALEELLARIRALLRRISPEDPEILRYDDLECNTATRRVTRGDTEITLTRTEFRLLELLMLYAERVLTRDMISAEVWEYDFGPASNSLDVYISYLRRKTETGGAPRLIQTVRGVGYVLRASAENVTASHAEENKK
ncbi:MAG: response regulator transcription factor [Acidimicrobiales bacterium]